MYRLQLVYIIRIRVRGKLSADDPCNADLYISISYFVDMPNINEIMNTGIIV